MFGTRVGILTGKAFEVSRKLASAHVSEDSMQVTSFVGWDPGCGLFAV